MNLLDPTLNPHLNKFLYSLESRNKNNSSSTENHQNNTCNPETTYDKAKQYKQKNAINSFNKQSSLHDDKIIRNDTNLASLIGSKTTNIISHNVL